MATVDSPSAVGELPGVSPCCRQKVIESDLGVLDHDSFDSARYRVSDRVFGTLRVAALDGQGHSWVACSTAQAAICVREVNPSLVSIFSTWPCAVRWDITSCAAMALLVNP